eukprot:TRINITY_DN23321_c0_g4_i2.p4 TRINITY_DN23321_c0_g4~~TRINITY_DN23321_c0_g4_i2.p4  ORF type:complete len:134 (+),score=18.56 TRINITY_DN23321_c0_g4_i2:1043-1444(+)
MIGIQQQMQPQMQAQQMMMHPHQQRVWEMGNMMQQPAQFLQGQQQGGVGGQQGDLYNMLQQDMGGQQDGGRRQQHRGDRRGNRDRDRHDRYGRRHGRRHGGRGGQGGYDNFHHRQKRGADNSDSDGQRKRNRM